MNVDLQVGDGKKNVFSPAFTYNPKELIVITNSEPSEFKITPRGNIELPIIPNPGQPVIFVEQSDFYEIVEHLLVLGLKTFDRKITQDSLRKISTIDAFFLAAQQSLDNAKIIDNSIAVKLEDINNKVIRVESDIRNSGSMVQNVSDVTRNLYQEMGNVRTKLQENIDGLKQQVDSVQAQLNPIKNSIERYLKEIDIKTKHLDQQIANNEIILKDIKQIYSAIQVDKQYLDNLWDKPITAVFTLPKNGI
jgi:archaellum component FlaC